MIVYSAGAKHFTYLLIGLNYKWRMASNLKTCYHQLLFIHSELERMFGKISTEHAQINKRVKKIFWNQQILIADENKPIVLNVE